MKRAVMMSLWMGLGLAAGAALIPAAAAQQSGQGLRGLAIVPDEEKRSRLVDIVAAVPVPEAMRPAPSDAQRGELRDMAVRAGKEMAIRRVNEDLRTALAGGASLKEPISPDHVFIVDAVELPIEGDRYSLHMRTEVRYALAASSAPTTPNAPIASGAASPTPGQMTAGATRPTPGEMGASAAQVGTASAPSGTTAGTSDSAVPLGSAMSGPDAAKDQPLTVQLRTDRQTYQDGDQLTIYLNGTRDFYARLDFEDVTGKIIQILPNDIRKEGFFKAGTEYAIPGDGDKFKLVVKPPFGNERIRLHASTAQLPVVPATPTADGAALVQVTREDVARRVRSLTIVPTEQVAQSGAAASEPPAGAAGAAAVVQASATGQARPEIYEASWEITTMTR